MRNTVDYIEPGILRVRSKKGNRAWLIRITDNGGITIGHWKGDTKPPPWVLKECS